MRCWRVRVGVSLVLVLAACGDAPPATVADAGSVDVEVGHGADAGGVDDAGAADAGDVSDAVDAGDVSVDAGTGGQQVSVFVEAVQRCAVNPPDVPGLPQSTPTGATVTFDAVELLRSRDDTAPALLSVSRPGEAVDVGHRALVAEGEVPPGEWRLLRYTLRSATVSVSAVAHQQGFGLPGTLTFDVALTSFGARPAGQLVASFSSSVANASFTASTPLDCPLSAAGGVVETGTTYRVVVPVPGGPLHATAGGAAAVLEARFPLADAFVWHDVDAADFIPGVVDITANPGTSETPALMPACSLLMSDRCEADVIPLRHRPAWPMPDSSTTTCTDGQALTACPAPGALAWGQDGNSAVNAPHFVVDGDVVHDEVTGLTWQRAVPAASFDWWEAQAYCAGLSLGGRDDWSLPSRIELVSLLDVGRFGPSIDLLTFPGASTDFFWSASPALFSSLAFGVRFDEGFVYDHDPRVSGRVRCVAGGHQGPEARYTVAGDMVEDTGTGLRWQRGVNAAKDWTSALQDCVDLRLGGFDDWRLPTVKELLTLVDESALDPSLDVAAFPDTPSEWLWASSPGLAPPSYAWAVSFTDGFSTPAAATQHYVSRCVR